MTVIDWKFTKMEKGRTLAHETSRLSTAVEK